jgi:hypothetical protein
VARQHVNWASLAQDFFCAALIVGRENQKCHDWLHANDGKVITDEIAVGLHRQRAGVFCMAFAVELVIKAVYVKKIGCKHMKPNSRIDFGNHGIVQMAEEIAEASLTDSEKEAIRIAQEIIVNGKYPSSKKPKKDTEPLSLPNLRRAIDMMEPVYKKFAGYIREHKK